MSNLTSGSAPLRVTFNGTTNAPASNWVYYFGDVTSGAGPNTTYLYFAAGPYTVKVTANMVGVQRGAVRHNYITLT